jgi:hypothetical protein
MDSTDISNQIGALELGDHLESHGDGVLESAGEFGGPPTAQTKLQGGCTHMCTFRCIGDGALEAAGADVAIGPSVGACRPPPTLLRCVSDGALEQASDTTMSGPSRFPTLGPAQGGTC